MEHPEFGLRFAYADTTSGQMHYRRGGTGQPLLLLHWTPGSGAQYDAVLPEFARRGHAACAPDLMGFGSSARHEAGWLIEDHAANLLDFAREIGWSRFALLGGHLAAEIAAQMSVRAPDRITHLILDGSPVWTRQFRTELLASIMPTGAPQPVEDGSHLTAWWTHILWEMRMWNPNFRLDAAGGAQAMRILLNDLQSGFDMSGAHALAEFDMDECLAKVRVPTLALTATTDPLAAEHAKVLKLVPHAAGHVFAGDHPIHDPARAAEYAAVVARFLAGGALSPAQQSLSEQLAEG